MTWPNDVVTRTVTGTYLSALGNAAKGRVTFTPTTRVIDDNDAVIVEDTLTAALDINGSFEIDLPTTDNLLLHPKDWAYEVNVRIYGVKPQNFYVTLPRGNGTPVDIVDQISLNSNLLVSDGTAPGQSQGPAGPRGPGTLVGAGVPVNSLGFDGDIYINVSTGSYYGPKTNGVWSLTPIFTIPGPENDRYVHTQAAPSSTWNVTHDLGGRPSVTVVDSAGTVVIGEIRYNNDTSVTILFTAPFSGYAYLT